MSLGKRSAAECLGTFWLVFCGCGSALFAAAVPTEIPFLTIGIGYPLALNTGGFIADCCTKGEPLPLTDLDRSLAAKIRKQVSA